MKYFKQKLGTPGMCLMLCALLSALAGSAVAQVFGTTTVQGTVYLANGAPGSGTLQISWPAFSTAANQAVAAGRTNVSIGSDGFVSVKLAPNLGAMPAGLFYTAVYHLSDGATSTEYWVVPAAAQAALAQVRAQVIPAAQAVQAVNKAYVDQSIAQLVQNQVTSGGGSMTGPLYLNGDPVTSPQAATKHYVDNQIGQTLSINGGAATGPLTAVQLGAAYQVDQFPGSDFGAKLQACINALNSTYGGSCDARNFSGTLSMATNLSIAKANVTVNLPCATIATSSQVIVTAGTRNVTLHGCASRGTSAASGSQGGTVFMYSGSAAMIQVGDSTYTADTLGFHLDNVVLNTTSSTAATAQAFTVWRAQELHLDSLYVLGNANQTGITLDGTGNYTGGTLQDVQIGGFRTAINAIGHQVANAAPTDWVNASTFVRLHINCPTSNGSAISGTSGINLLQGDGNTITGGDVEGCATALHLGPNAQNNTIVGLRNENSTNQVVADAGSAYNNWITGGTMFTGKLIDNGTRNSFLDTFHRSFNALNGDWFGSQQDSTLTNHFRLGIGSGTERGLLNRYQTDSGYRWTMGLSDATAGEQYYSVLDELNGVNRLSIGQYNTGQGSSNNQTVVNAAGTGAVILNGSNNAGSGGVVFGSGGATSATVATINNAGSAQFNGTLQVSGASTFLNSTSIKNQADAEVDAFLWAGATAPQKESVIYKDWNGNSQWYMVKDASNNWALNSAVGGVDSFKAYQSTNSGDTYLDAANNTGVVRVNYEPGSGSAFNVYGGGSGSLYASFNGTTGIKFPGLAAGSGKNCVQIDSSGYLSNTGLACGASSVGTGTIGQFAYYPGNGSTLSGMTAIPVGSGGTGATSASAALTSLGGLPMAGGALSGPLAGTTATFSGQIQAQSVSVASDQPTGHQAASANAAVTELSVMAFGAVGDRKSLPNNVTFTSGQNTMATNMPGTFGQADVGKAVVTGNRIFSSATTLPDAAQVAYITAVTDSQNIVLSKSAIVSGGSSIAWGTDNTPAFNACETAAHAAGGGTCKVPAGNYLLATSPNYVLWGAYDDGSYGTSAGGSGANVTATLGTGATAGQITGYTITNGGAGYTPNSHLQMSMSGGCGSTPLGIASINQGPCGWAYALANTNGTGVVTSITSVSAGYGFVTAPTVAVQPMGGDGAAATATISDGAITAYNITNGGGGYTPSSSSLPVWGINGTGCAAISPYTSTLNSTGVNVTAAGTATTNSSGTVAGIAWSNTGSGCITAPTLVFGPFTCWNGTNFGAQWTNIAPLQLTRQPVRVAIWPGVSWEGTPAAANPFGLSANLYGPWDGATADNNQPVMFGASMYFQAMSFSGLQLYGDLVGIGTTFSIVDATLTNSSFYTGIGAYFGGEDNSSQISNLAFHGPASYVVGGTWAERTDSPGIAGGLTNPQILEHIFNYAMPYVYYHALDSAIDDWFANTFFHPEFTARNNDFWETCAFPQAPNQRQTGHSIVMGSNGNYMCYPGITNWSVIELAKNGGGNDTHNIHDIEGIGGSRGIYYGDLGNGTFNFGFCCEGGQAIASDPYRHAAIPEGGVIYHSAGLVENIGFGFASGTAKQAIYNPAGIPGAGKPEGFPFGSWRNITCSSCPSSPFYLATDWNIGASSGGQTQAFNAVQLGNPSIDNYGGTFVTSPNGVSLYNNATDILDLTTSGGGVFHGGLTAPALIVNGGTQATGTVGNGGKLQETTSAAKASGSPVAFDANGNTVNATAANVASLFTSCSGIQYLGADGVCHTASTTYTLPPASTTVVGGIKCDGTTVTCAGDGTISAVSGGAGTITGVTPGYGISGGGTTGSVTLAVSLSRSSSFIASDLALPSAGSYDVASLSLAAGTWVISAQIAFSQTSNSPVVYCTIWDGTNIGSSGVVQVPAVAQMSLQTGAIVLASTTTYRITCYPNGAGATIKAGTLYYNKNATGLFATRLQ